LIDHLDGRASESRDAGKTFTTEVEHRDRGVIGDGAGGKSEPLRL